MSSIQVTLWRRALYRAFVAKLLKNHLLAVVVGSV
jgi:hypothetical protein